MRILFLFLVLIFTSFLANAQNENWDEVLKKVESKITQKKYQDAAVILDRISADAEVPDSIRKKLYFTKLAVAELSSERVASIDVFENAALEYKDDFLINLTLAFLYCNSGKNQKAKNQYKHLLGISENWKDTANAMLTLSGVYFNETNWDSVMSINQHIVSRDSSFILECFNNMALVHFSKKEYEKGIPLLVETIKKDTNQAFATYNNIGMLYTEIGKYQNAISAFENCISLNPIFPYVYSNLGFCYHKMKEYDKAIVLYNKSIELGPENSWVYKNKALTYIELKMNKEACEYLSESKRRGYETFYGQEVNELIKEHCEK
jgi:tetratricopeptide (TPR) repeat protein